MIAGIELGGTKTVVAYGDPDGRVATEWRFPTTDPHETLARAVAWLAEKGCPEAIGIASFGPLGISPDRPGYGQLLATPKPGWSGFSLTEALATAFPRARLSIDTDVNAAALAEARLGAGLGVENLAYITIGTGIGAGILNKGRPLHGATHPEFGHLKIPRAPGDAFRGICPFHRDCLEGMASGPAILARWGHAAAELPAEHPAWELEAWYLAHGILALLAVASPARIVIGGGVSQADGFHAMTAQHLSQIAGGYFPAIDAPDFIAPPALGQQAGIHGALLLAGS